MLKKLPHRDALIFFGFGLVTLALKYTILRDPHFWDAMGGIVAPALDMYDHGVRLIHPTRNFGHPPLQPLSLALLWAATRYSLLSAHLSIVLFGVAGLCATYKLGELWGGKLVGLGAALLLLFNQIFFAQLGIVNDTIPLLTFGTLAVYFYVTKKPVWCALMGTLLVLTKETGAMLLFALWLHWLVVFLRSRPPWPGLRTFFLNALRESWPLITPVLILLLWFAYHKLALGWAFRTDLFYNKSNFIFTFYSSFFAHFVTDIWRHSNVNYYNFVLLGVILLDLCTQLRTPFKTAGAAGQRYTLFSLIIFCYLLLFSYTDNIPRYFAPLLPFFYIMGAGALQNVIRKFLWHRAALPVFASMVLCVCLLFVTNYDGTRDEPGWRLESNMEYRDMLSVHLAMADYITAQHPGKLIVTYWPLTDQLLEPRNGYVTRPQRVVDITENKREQYAWPNATLIPASFPTGTLLYTSAPTTPFAEKLKTQYTWRVIQAYSVRGKTASLFELVNSGQ